VPGGREVVTRDRLKRELAVNAATKPLTVVVPTLVAIAGLVLGAPWLLALAVVLYLGLALVTFFDKQEAKRVGEATYAAARRPRSRALDDGRFSPAIQRALEAAQLEEERIRQAIAQARVPFSEVSAEVDTLMGEMERIAGKAQGVHDYLSAQDPAATRQRLRELRSGRRAGEGETTRALERAAEALAERLKVGEELRGELERFFAEMEHLAASLGVVHGQLVRVNVAEEASLQDDLAGEVRSLRERVGAVAEGLGAAFERAPASEA